MSAIRLRELTQKLGRGATFGRTAANLLIEERELEAGGLN